MNLLRFFLISVYCSMFFMVEYGYGSAQEASQKSHTLNSLQQVVQQIAQKKDKKGGYVCMSGALGSELGDTLLNSPDEVSLPGKFTYKYIDKAERWIKHGTQSVVAAAEIIYNAKIDTQNRNALEYSLSTFLQGASVDPVNSSPMLKVKIEDGKKPVCLLMLHHYPTGDASHTYEQIDKSQNQWQKVNWQNHDCSAACLIKPKLPTDQDTKEDAVTSQDSEKDSESSTNPRGPSKLSLGVQPTMVAGVVLVVVGAAVVCAWRYTTTHKKTISQKR